MIAYRHGTHTCRSTCIQKVAYLQGAKLADISDNPVHRKNHVTRISFLHFPPVNIQMETDVLDIRKLFYGYPIADSRRIIKTFTEFPRFPSERKRRCKSRAVKSIPTVTAS